MKHLHKAILGLSFIATGCGPRGMEATVSGTVSIDGKPAPAGIEVEFQPQVPNASPSKGVTDANGRYALRFNAYRDGVMAGESVVALSIRRTLGPDGAPGPIPEALAGVRIPADYVGPASRLSRTVARGFNQIDIDVQTSSVPPRE